MTPETQWEICWLESKRIPFFKDDFKPNVQVMAFVF